ncbi:hypothetical protein FA13DRAFT_1455926 [Coprinellus micaceus]|uniref:Uncharacterized protein n=1 Tax=Coprinellus micaceus TaxID=71717 RepID=A0A4Y7SNA5_COPMI|nr:hypothetical protein FA13DRAFT_1455926 [Coprinellus micaceus]
MPHAHAPRNHVHQLARVELMTRLTNRVRPSCRLWWFERTQSHLRTPFYTILSLPPHLYITIHDHYDRGMCPQSERHHVSRLHLHELVHVPSAAPRPSLHHSLRFGIVITVLDHNRQTSPPTKCRRLPPPFHLHLLEFETTQRGPPLSLTYPRFDAALRPHRFALPQLRPDHRPNKQIGPPSNPNRPLGNDGCAGVFRRP